MSVSECRLSVFDVTTWFTQVSGGSLVVAILVVAGCGEAADPGVAPVDEQTRAPLINGEPVGDDSFGSTGGLVLDLELEEGEETPVSEWSPDPEGDVPAYGIWCSGTLVSPTEVVTAAHCVMGNSLDELPEFTLATDVRSVSSDEVYGIEEAHVHPDYPEGQYGHDIAVVRLDEPLEDVPYARLPGDEEQVELTEGSELELVGYGYRDWSAEMDDFLREPDSNPDFVEEFIEDYQPGLKQYGTTAIGELEELLIVAAGSEDGLRVADMDSGGPAFAQNDAGERRLVGVASRMREDEERLDDIAQICDERETTGECVGDEDPQICEWSEGDDRCTRFRRASADPRLAVVGTEYVRAEAYLEWLDEVLEERPAEDSDSSADEKSDEPDSSCRTVGTTPGGLVAVALAILVLAAGRRRSPQGSRC